jgi:VWFA-related protein
MRSHPASPVRSLWTWFIAAAAVVLLCIATPAQQGPPPPQAAASPQQPGTLRFKTGVEMVNVTATVFDASGHFVSGLTKDDFSVYDDDEPQQVTEFSADRVPVSLGIAIDTSGSMDGEKIHEARSALGRFVYELLGPRDEIFISRFSNEPQLVQGWTTDRQLLTRALSGLVPSGGTALFDAAVQALPLVAKGHNLKKALLVLSDGRDTSSHASLTVVRQAIRESEALVYAIGIDCAPSERAPRGGSPSFQQAPIPVPLPFPGRRPPFPPRTPTMPPPSTQRVWPACTDPVDVVSLRDLTDESGGRTEVIRDPRDLNPATEHVADELSKQYYLGYASSGRKDGRWHAIRVEVKNKAYRVRARRGYLAS